MWQNKSGFPGQLLELEITESAPRAEKPEEALAVLSRLRGPAWNADRPSMTLAPATRRLAHSSAFRSICSGSRPGLYPRYSQQQRGRHDHQQPGIRLGLRVVLKVPAEARESPEQLSSCSKRL